MEYKFSAPMPYSKEDIDKVLDINNQVKKSKITSLYACVPRGCEVFTGFEQSRTFSFDNISWNYWKSLIEHVLSKGCDFIYLLNSPRPIDFNNFNFLEQLDKLKFLLTELRKIGVKKLRLASLQLMSYIGTNYNDFEVLASTSLEYKTICEYQNFIIFHPEVTQIVPSHDLNKNFNLLKNLKKRFSNIEIELIINEGCIQGCPNRQIHASSPIDKGAIINNDICLSDLYNTNFCSKITDKYPLFSLIFGNHIFPWEIEEYAKLGIQNFKLVGRDGFFIYSTQTYIDMYRLYLTGVDNINSIKNYAISGLVHRLIGNQYLNQFSIKKYKNYLPKINYFKKYGHLCASRCGVECRYCYKCAEKIQKVFEKKQAEQRKRNIPVCI